MKRLDPNYIKNIPAVNNIGTPYPLIPLKSLLAQPPMYGANEMAVEGNRRTDVRYIRITDIDTHGNLHDDDWKTAKKVDKKYMLDEDDILFARSGATAGKAFIYTRDHAQAIFAGYLIRFRFDRTRINPLFVFYYTQLSRYRFWVRIVQRPSGQPNINSREFCAFRIPLPPHNVQEYIIGIMKSAYARKNQLDRQVDGLLNSVNDCVLQALRVEIPTVDEKKCFVIHSSEIDRRIDPNAYRLLRTRSVEATELSPYEYVPLKDSVEFRKETVACSNELPYVGLENIESNTGFYVPSTELKGSFNTALSFKIGDVLFPKLRPYLNKVHFATFNGFCSTKFHVLNGPNLNNLYLYAFLRSKLVLNQTTCLMTGNTLPRLQTREVESLPILLPPMKVQNEIADEVKHYLIQAKEIKKQAENIVNTAKRQVEGILLNQDSD